MRSCCFAQLFMLTRLFISVTLYKQTKKAGDQEQSLLGTRVLALLPQRRLQADKQLCVTKKTRSKSNRQKLSPTSLARLSQQLNVVIAQKLSLGTMPARSGLEGHIEGDLLAKIGSNTSCCCPQPIFPAYYAFLAQISPFSHKTKIVLTFP